jgi:hypothetical protein
VARRRAQNALCYADVGIYGITTNQAAIARLFRAMNQNVGNLPPMPGVFPIIRPRWSAMPPTVAS